MAEARQFEGNRTGDRHKNNLGIINAFTRELLKTYRNKQLDIFDAYYESRQYNHLAKWDTSCSAEYVKVRERKPRVNYPFAKLLSSRLASKLVGRKHFPTLKIEQDPDTEDYIRLIIKSANLKSKLVEPMRRCLASGSVFVRFSINMNKWKIQHYLSKWCYPEFDDLDELTKVRVQYVYEDKEDLDVNKQPKKKWYKLEMDKEKDVLFDNPEFKTDAEPEFTIVESVKHGLNMVQGEWVVTHDMANEIDGPSVIGDALDFIDEMNYSLSQSLDATAYNQDPQLTLNNMDEDEISNLIRSSQKAWNLGREGQAQLLEANMSGVETAMAFRDKIQTSIQDIARVVMLDPEKVVGHAQSAKAMEVLHGPLIELIEELRPQIGIHIINLLKKMALSNFLQFERLKIAPVPIPEGYVPQSSEMEAVWPEVFPQTMQDLQTKASVGVSVASANLISRETITRWLGPEFDVEDIEEEVRKVNEQPVINPFGGF